MLLTEFSYKDDSWELRNLEFGEASLIVGKNATGKSRTLRQLSNFFNIIRQSVHVLPAGEFTVKFVKSELEYYIYKLVISENLHTLSISEEFRINNVVVLKREPHGETRILNKITSSFEIISPPGNKLAIHVNRDTKKYPFFEDIAVWAERCYTFKFGSILPGLTNIDTRTGLSEYNVNITYLYSELGDKQKERVLFDLREIGYPLEYVNFIESIPSDFLQIKERGIKVHLIEEEISQGMLRSIYIIIFLSYLIYKGIANIILIDDLCEGLDYERATKLGSLVFQRCKENNIQLIATSNDMFLMDVVDIKYWNVLQRKDNLITSVNAKNNPALFENFKFTGLSNFDFFASDYISQKLDK